MFNVVQEALETQAAGHISVRSAATVSAESLSRHAAFVLGDLGAGRKKRQKCRSSEGEGKKKVDSGAF